MLQPAAGKRSVASNKRKGINNLMRPPCVTLPVTNISRFSAGPACRTMIRGGNSIVRVPLGPQTLPARLDVLLPLWQENVSHAAGSHARGLRNAISTAGMIHLKNPGLQPFETGLDFLFFFALLGQVRDYLFFARCVFLVIHYVF